MKESLWAYIIIVLGLFILTVLIVSQNITSTSEENYYLVKETMEASMLEAIDFGHYRKTGELKIVREKFIEIFVRRFAESVVNSKDYKIDFYNVYEYPPKASVRISTSTGEYSFNLDAANFDVYTLLSGILETKY